MPAIGSGQRITRPAGSPTTPSARRRRPVPIGAASTATAQGRAHVVAQTVSANGVTPTHAVVTAVAHASGPTQRQRIIRQARATALKSAVKALKPVKVKPPKPIKGQKNVLDLKLKTVMAKAPKTVSKTQKIQSQFVHGKKTLPGLSPQQTKVAAKVLKTGVKLGATKKELVSAAETGIVESGLQNLKYGTSDSQGWRQERTSIYGVPHATSVKKSAKDYFRETASAGRGHGVTAGTLAQSVQRSAFPARYDQQAAPAKTIVKSFLHGQTASVPQQPATKEQVSRFKAIERAAQRINSAHLPYEWGGGHVTGKIPGPRRTAYDCSGVVSKVLQEAHALPSGAMTSSGFMSYGEAGPGAVTIFANPEHVFMRIGNRYFGTSHLNPGGGAGFVGTSAPDDLSNYTVRHVPGLGQEVTSSLGVKPITPGISLSASGTSARVTSSTTVGTPGSSSLPPRPDARDLKQKIQAKARRKVFNQAVSALSKPQAAPKVSKVTKTAYASYANRKIDLGLS